MNGQDYDAAVLIRILYASAKHAFEQLHKDNISKTKKALFKDVLLTFTAAVVAKYDKLVSLAPVSLLSKVALPVLQQASHR